MSNLTSDIEPNYLLIHEHIAYMVWALLASSEATTAPKQPQRSNPNYLSMCILLIWYGSFWQPEATKASKQLQRSNMTSDLKPVTPITYLSMCILILCCGPFWQPQRPPQPLKQPWRSNLTSDLKSVTPITYLSMCIFLKWYGSFWQPLRPL